MRLGTHRLTSTRVAIKQIPKAMSASLTREIHHHRQLHHPHVTQMYEVIATESSIWIVTELCSGGELFDYLAEKSRLAEDEARVLFGQLCLAVYYLHEKGIVHRDLKLENVLLDERCRVKLGDFGFTREYERGTYMETFCGTTGYASPEMLLGKKYLGPEVDVWSLGIILYCLLTGTLPFDDDDESVMRDIIIQGDFEDPEWLSKGAFTALTIQIYKPNLCLDARNLIQNILVKDPTKRLTIPQILAHTWFTRYNDSTQSLAVPNTTRPPSPPPSLTASPLCMPVSVDTSSSLASDSTFLSASSEFVTSAPTTPDDHSSHGEDPFDLKDKGDNDEPPVIHRSTSESTIRKTGARSHNKPSQQPETSTVPEEEVTYTFAEDIEPVSTPIRPNFQNQYSGSSKGPPALPARTPARTKRRSVSSTLSDPSSPTSDKPLTPLPPQDFSSLLNTPAPMIFSTLLERQLLNSLSMIGFDTGQIVHSVLCDACDASGAVWWMLKRKSEKKALEEDHAKLIASATLEHVQTDSAKEREVEKGRDTENERAKEKERQPKRGVSVQTEITSAQPLLSLAQSAPELAFVPATPTVPSTADSTTPPRTSSPMGMGQLSPSMSPSLSGVDLARSHPSTPVGHLKEKETKARRDGKNRSGSVSIMQRATTALEAAGLVRKKSNEAVRDHQEKDREREKVEKKAMSGEEPRSSHGSSSSKLTKSPPIRASRDAGVPTTPPLDDMQHPHHLAGSPWVVTGSKTSPPQSYAPTPANSPGDTLTSLPNFSQSNTKVPNRNRASLLSAFRLWFNEDRKGKRKEPSPRVSPGNSRGPMYRSTIAVSNSLSPGNKGSVKRRPSDRSSGTVQKTSRRGKRQSVSSRRSSSVNSKRSSGTSGLVLDSPHMVLDQIPTRRSFGAHTPNSERGDYPSRPSSVRSFSLNRHRKSPSASSAGSAHFRTSSPIQKYHRRAGSGSSTRVVRQIQSSKPTHARSNSAASSVHSLCSSRPTSFYEPSENEGQRTGSPYKRPQDDTTPRRTTYSSTTFIAQKRQTPFTSPGGHANVNSIGRSSWRKSWGLEPPGWQSRATHLPIEVLAVSPAVDSAGSIRDVFSGRASLNLGDEDDWVDEDDDIPAFAGGLGQMPISASSSSTFGHLILESPMTLSPPPRGHSNRSSTKRTNRNPGLSSANASNSAGRQKAGHSPVGRTSPVQVEVPYDSGGAGRRQLPTGRSGPAFRGHAIVEEDEGEEE